MTLADARQAAATLTGTILQMPPMVSAVKVGGRRLHQLARQGIEVERPPRHVTVTRFSVEPLPPDARPEPVDGTARCSRCASSARPEPTFESLAADLGAALGGGAHLRQLRRTAVGPWTSARRPPWSASAAATSSRLPPRCPGWAGSWSDAGAVPAEVVNGRVLDRDVLARRGDRCRAVAGHRTRGRSAGGVRAGHGGRAASSPPWSCRRPELSPCFSDGSTLVTPSVVTCTGMQILHYPGDCATGDGLCRHDRSLRRGASRAPTGHRRVRAMAAEQGLASAVVTFDQHPAAVVRPESAPRLLTDLEQKLELLDSTGIDYVVVVHFDKARSEESAEDFVREVLVGLRRRPGRRRRP